MERPPRRVDAAVTATPAYSGPERRRLINRSWPLPAFAAWAACWIVFASVAQLGAAPAAAFVAAGLRRRGALVDRRRRRGDASSSAAAFRCRSLVLFGSGVALPAWAWLLALALLAVVYPLRAWRDAPIFPTPAGALRGLAQGVPLAPRAAVLDAGCGLGAGLVELRREYPRRRARRHRMELAALARRRGALPLCAQFGAATCGARTGRGFALVYLFQRPESMARAAAKAAHELRPGAWLASLEFEIASAAAAAGPREWRGPPRLALPRAVSPARLRLLSRRPAGR